jgi:hypothetical protein
LEDVFGRDLVLGITVRASVDSSGGQANAASFSPALSADGNFVAFTSGASDLVAGDANQFQDVFRHDFTTGATIRVSVDSAGGDADGDSYSSPGALSADSASARAAQMQPFAASTAFATSSCATSAAERRLRQPRSGGTGERRLLPAAISATARRRLRYRRFVRRAHLGGPSLLRPRPRARRPTREPTSRRAAVTASRRPPSTRRASPSHSTASR